jgi:hypothetical protein
VGGGGAVAMRAGAATRLVGQLISAGAIFSAGVLGWYNCISAAMCQRDGTTRCVNAMVQCIGATSRAGTILGRYNN